ATLDEEHSTRGRANALRAVLSGRAPRSDFTGRRLYQVLDLCLECKACKAECPANVDMAKLKYEFLAHYYRANGLPLRNRLFARIHALARLGSALAPLSNWIARSAPNRWLLDRVAGIDRRRPLPAFAGTSFTTWFRRHRPGGTGAPAHRGCTGGGGAELPPRGVRGAGDEGRTAPADPGRPRPGRAGPSPDPPPRSLPPEGPGRHGADARRAPSGGVSGDGGGRRV